MSVIAAGASPSTTITAAITGRVVLPVVLAVAVIRPRRRIATTPTIVICTHGYSSSYQRHGNQSRSCCILVLYHLRAIECLNPAAIQFSQDILLEDRILILKICPTERRLIDRFRIGVKCLARSGACAQGARNEQGAKRPQINNCQKSPQYSPRDYKNTQRDWSRVYSTRIFIREDKKKFGRLQFQLTSGDILLLGNPRAIDT